MHVLVRQDGWERDEALRHVASDDCDKIVVVKHLTARGLLCDKFFSDEKNTRILTEIANDEEGSGVFYQKIGSTH